MNIYVDTCVLPRSRMDTGAVYRESFGPSLGFELLPMFDLPDFEASLKENAALYSAGPLTFHEPVWGVEHSAERGSRAWEEGMYHIRKTVEWAGILKPASMVYHLNNCAVPPEEKDRMLKNTLENLEEIRDLFPNQQILVENTGTLWDKTALLTQAEFTDLCRARHLPVLIDVGHANANGWDIPKLIRDLKDQIGGFHLHNNDGIHDFHNRLREGTLDLPAVISVILSLGIDVPMVVEYTRPVYHGEPLKEDIAFLKELGEAPLSAPEKKASPPAPSYRFEPDRVAHIFNNMEDAVCVAGKSGELLFANPAAKQLFGLQDLSIAKIWDAIPYVPENDGLIQLFIDAVTEKKKTVRSLVDYVNNEGTDARLHVSITCDSQSGDNLLIVISDLTRVIRLQSAFARYTSPEIADFVLNTPEGEKQGGQSRNVTIMMSDLRGFTALSSAFSSDDLIRMINNYFGEMSPIIRRHEGTVIEFLGDGIFTVFGAPEDLPNHAEMAVRCAVDMQCAMEKVNEWNRQQGFPPLEMGIGIHTGNAIVGNIGSEEKMKYGCIGRTVNLAGRIESLSVGGEVIISGDTARLCGSSLKTENERIINPKGSSVPMKIYDVRGIGRVSLPAAEEESSQWISLPEKGELECFRLEGKFVEPLPFEGRLARITADEKNGILAAQSSLDPMMNLMLRIGSHDIYAKVMKKTADGYLLRFTMKPGNLTELLS